MIILYAFICAVIITFNIFRKIYPERYEELIVAILHGKKK